MSSSSNNKATFAKQFRAVFLKNVTEEVRQRKLVACQVAVPAILLFIVLLVELLIGAKPDIVSGSASYTYARNLQPYPSTFLRAFVVHDEGHDAGDAMIGRAPPSNWTCNGGLLRGGLLGYMPQKVEEWFESRWLNVSEGGCSPQFIDSFDSWPAAEAEFKSAYIARARIREERDWNSYEMTPAEREAVYAAPFAVYGFQNITLGPEAAVLDFTVYTNDDLGFAQGAATFAYLMHDTFFRMVQNYSFEELLDQPADNATYKRIGSSYVLFDSMPRIEISYRIIDIQLQMFLITFALFTQIPFLMHRAVNGRQTGWTEMIEMMGMRVSSFWISNFLHDLVIYYIVVALFLVVSFAAGIQLVSKAWMVSILLLLWGPAQTAVAYFLSCFFRKTASAVVCGYLFAMAFLGVGLGLCFVFNGDSAPPAYFMVFPPLAFSYGVFCAARAISNPEFTVFYAPAAAHAQVGISIAYFLSFGVVFLLLAVWLDPVLPKRVGQSKPFYWPLRALLTRLRASRPPKAARHHVLVPAEAEFAATQTADETVDEDVRKEADAVRDAATVADSGIVIHNITKTFGSGASVVNALKGVSFHVAKGECFGLLGSNGAGKTTLVNILSGFMRATSGQALIQGRDIEAELGKVQRHIGLCPQNDILCDDLTVREHLLFYARLKGCPRHLESEHVEKLIEEVGLKNERRRLAKDLSGGQKRRLSLAIALTGNPGTVFLDEPSSGLDPGSTRELWDVLLRARTGRCFLLTTHSMSEADTCCTRIGILSQGRLRCIGTQTRLKRKFGQGYKAEIFATPERQPEVASFFAQLVPDAEAVSQTQNALVYRLPRSCVLSELFQRVEADKYRHGIQSWSISQSSLDEVFISIVRADEEGGAEVPAPAAATLP